MNYLEFKPARCKDCYKCLRNCPVKAIEVVGHQARIIESRCILCGKCTTVCPQNAKYVHSEADDVLALLASGNNVIASVAPSFVSSFSVYDFGEMRRALKELGFSDAEETAVGALTVTAEYKKLLEEKKFDNFITSCCPAVNRMIQLYYPAALQYLAPVDSPMIAHAKILKQAHPEAKIVFIGPCIAKKREGKESGWINGVLTFEDLKLLLEERKISFRPGDIEKPTGEANRAKYYPISRGIIKSFDGFVEGYEYVAVDGVEKCREVLENIGHLSGLFLELNSCEYACVNGPCSLISSGSAVRANADIRKYTNREFTAGTAVPVHGDVPIAREHKRVYTSEYVPSEREIAEVLARTGKFAPEDELNCGACGYNTCREKAWAVLNGYAATEMCVPYMRERAESMSYEVIQNSPNGIVLVDNDLKIAEINRRALELLGLAGNVRGELIFDYFDPTDFVLVQSEEKNIHRKKMHIEKTDAWVEYSVILLKKQKMLFAVMKDITAEAHFDEQLKRVKMDTLSTTDEVIKKQMRVAQEIASLLGETTAETKVALLKLKETLTEESRGD